MDENKKLNVLQQGLLQKVFTYLVYLLCVIIFGLFLDTLEKGRFIVAIEKAISQGVVSQEAFQALRLAIVNKDSTEIIYVVAAVIACILAGRLLMRWSGKFNWAWSVLLPKAIEFRTAMEQLGINDPDDRIDFVRKHKIPVFIASAPLTGREQDTVRARFYAFAHHPSLGEKNVFERHIGKQTLCLDANNFSWLVEECSRKTNIAYSTRIASLERDIDSLTGTNSLHVAKIAELTEENEKLLEANAGFQRKQQTAPGRKRKVETSHIRRIPFWRVAAPLINRLIEKAQPSTQYSRRDIQAAFDAEVEKYPDLKDGIRKELHIFSQKKPESEFELAEWAMNAIRAGLGDLAKDGPGLSRKL